MRSDRRCLRRLRILSVLALCVPLSAAAGASAAPAVHRATQQNIAAMGDTPADYAQPVAPAAAVGDTPADHPGMSRAPAYHVPATIQVVRPERTIVRTADAALPMVLAGLALLVALGGTGFALVRTRSLQRRVIGRS
jgi:hypothetical protein